MDPTNSYLNVLSWNANSIKHKIHQLYDFLQNEGIDIACIQETMYNINDLTPAHSNYVTYRNDRITDSRASGGVAIIIKKNIKHELLPDQNLSIIESIGVAVHLQNAKIEIRSVYLPGGTENDAIKQHFKTDIVKLTNRRCSFFNCGDLNAKHRMWNCSRANTAGKILHETYQNHNFLILHPSTHTYHSPRNNCQPSTIDIVLTNGLHDTSNFETHTGDSDHEMVTFHTHLLGAPQRVLHRKIPLFKDTNWERYQRAVESRLQPLPNHTEIDSTTKIDQYVSTLTNAILFGQETAVPLVTVTPYDVVLTPGIKAKILMRNETRRFAQRNPRMKPIVNTSINAQSKVIREEIDNLTIENFQHKVENICKDKSKRSLWKMSRFLKKRRNQVPPFKVDGTTLLTDEEKCNALAENFASNHNNPLANVQITHTRFVTNSVKRFMRNSIPDNPELVRTVETEKIIKGLKISKAPGMDKVHNSLIKKLPHDGVLLLTMIINACIKLSYFPSHWKHAKVIAICKPNKASSLPSSYRPISLLSSLSKILERVIMSRLVKHLDDNNVIPEFQHGFRKQRSTITQLHKLTQQIETNLSNRKSTGMLLMDVEKAYDRVWHDAMIFKLISINTPHYITKFIYSYLQNRSFHVDLQGTASATHQMQFGLPQGAALSPILYNIYTHDMPLLDNCKIALFADDTAILSESRLAKPIVKNLEKASKKVHKYCQKWKIKLNESKTQAIFFTRRRTRQIPENNFRFMNTEIPWESNSVKYLGLYLDKKLTYKEHVSQVIQKATMGMRILYSLLNRKSSLDTQTKLLLYKASIRPIFTYGAPILATIARTHQNKLQIFQNKLLRMIYNVPRSTPIAALHENVETVGEFLVKLEENFKIRQNLV